MIESDLERPQERMGPSEWLVAYLLFPNVVARAWWAAVRSFFSLAPSTFKMLWAVATAEFYRTLNKGIGEVVP